MNNCHCALAIRIFLFFIAIQLMHPSDVIAKSFFWSREQEIAFYDNFQAMHPGSGPWLLSFYLDWTPDLLVTKVVDKDLAQMTENAQEWLVVQQINRTWHTYNCFGLVKRSKENWQLFCFRSGNDKTILRKQLMLVQEDEYCIRKSLSNFSKVAELFDYSYYSARDVPIWYMSYCNNKKITRSAVICPFFERADNQISYQKLSIFLSELSRMFKTLGCHELYSPYVEF